MAHRRGTRSIKPVTAIIDLTQDAPLPIPRRTRSNRYAAPLPEVNPGPAYAPTERQVPVPKESVRVPVPKESVRVPVPKESVRVPIPKESVRVPKERKTIVKKKNASNPRASILPCLNTSVPGEPEMLMCPICFGPMSASREPTATQCGHVFCKECLMTSLVKRRRCPTCQSEARISKCVRLYLS